MMKIPREAVIPPEKLTRYLLLERPWDDKSKFLAQAGFDQTNPDRLLIALRELAEAYEAIPDSVSQYGEFLRVDGEIQGPNGRRLAVTTIWLRQQLDGLVRFVTLKPRREKR
jgi:hypothetical protein